MIRIFQALDAYGEQKVLLLAVRELDFIPNVGEMVDINGKEFVVLTCKHFITTPEVTQDLELIVIPPELNVEVEYIGQEDEFEDYNF